MPVRPQSPEVRKGVRLAISTALHKLWRVVAFLVATLGYNGLVFRQARKAASVARKPLLNVGCKSVYTESSNANLDIVPREVPRFVRGDIQNLHMFGDKQFGAVYASHVLEHVENPETALRELRRVGDNLFAITPFPLWPWTWLHPDHKWVFLGTKKLCRTPRFWWKRVTRGEQSNICG